MPAPAPLDPVGAPEPFADRLFRERAAPLRRLDPKILQINLGKRCNQSCAHCHVDAGPKRTEMMDRPTARACLAFLARTEIPTVDITGGAPELNPNFAYLVEGARELGRHVIDRCNLTVLLEPGQEGLVSFLAGHRVEIVSSLPCYLEENVDMQRGRGVFARSIEALGRLNAAGYGRPGAGLELALVYNPVGPHLPPAQHSLEADYKRELQARYGIVFTRLLTIANMPISRYRRCLEASGQLAPYMDLLAGAFNPATTDALMCKTTLSVGWDGRLYDCDFNQMLEIPLGGQGRAPTIFKLEPERLAGEAIATADHCYGCTAGAGSGCGGALA